MGDVIRIGLLPVGIFVAALVQRAMYYRGEADRWDRQMRMLRNWVNPLWDSWWARHTEEVGF